MKGGQGQGEARLSHRIPGGGGGGGPGDVVKGFLQHVCCATKQSAMIEL